MPKDEVEAKETSVSVTLSVRDWIVIGAVFVGLVAWGVRLETRTATIERDHDKESARVEARIVKLEERLDRVREFRESRDRRSQPGNGR